MIAQVVPLPLVTCTSCKVEQPASAFTPNRRKRNGLASWCKSCSVLSSDRTRRKDLKKANAQRLEYAQTLRLRVLEKYGLRCNNPQCAVPGGCRDIRCLHIDHVHNDGFKEKRNKNGGRSRVAILQRALRDTEGRFQLLCANCNMAKAWEHNRAIRAARGEKVMPCPAT